MATPKRINMAEAIRGPWEHVAITSFGVDLGFFERAILPQLAQTRGRLILADADHLLSHHADAVRGRLVRHLNRGYHAGGIHVSGVAHSKMILLLSTTRGRLLVGSGNLRLTGWGSTGEMFTQYDFSGEDESTLPPFEDARRFLDGLSDRHLLDDFSRAYLERMWAGVPWLGATAGAQGPVRHNLERPLLDLLTEAVSEVEERPQELVMAAPFHDGRCEAVNELLERIQPRRATLLVQPGHTSIDAAALEKVLVSHPELVVKPFGPRGDHGRYVHAKLVLVRFKKRSICLQGSANLSYAALMTTIPAGNVEVVNLLEDSAGAFDNLFSDLWIGKPETDVSKLEVTFDPIPSVAEPAGSRILEAIWDGELLTIHLSEPFSAAPVVWLTVGTALVEAQVVNVHDAPNRGGVILTVRPQQDVDDQFTRATPVALYVGSAPPGDDVGETEFTEPVFCVNQPYLIERLEAQPASLRLRDVGLMALDDDRELEELLRALQGSMVYDRRSLVEAAPSLTLNEEDPTDDQLKIAYADVDYEELRRSHARLHQYEGAMLIPGSAALGPIPTDIQLALRSITDAFSDVVGRPGEAATQVSFASDWGTEDDPGGGIEDLALIEENAEELETVEDDGAPDLEEIEEAAERRWSDDARMRVHWRRFIDRFLSGLASPAWQELVGTAVLSGNYELFSHVLQRLHRQHWQSFDFVEFLLQAQNAAHGFVWGRGAAPESGWLPNLPTHERQVVLSAFAERHLAVRLFVDLAAAGELSHPETFTSADRLLDERRNARDVARAVLASEAWAGLVAAEPRFAAASEAVASELCAGGDFACWLEAPSFATLVDRIEELVTFTTGPEFQRDIAAMLGVPAQKVVLGHVELVPDGKKVIAQDVGIKGLGETLDLETALGVMARFTAFYPGPRYRVHAGHERLLFDSDSGHLEWVAGLDEDLDLDMHDLPVIVAPWSSAVQALRELEDTMTQEAVA